MRIEVRGETEITVRPAGDALEIEATEKGAFGPLEMLAASLGTCTVAVLQSWARQAGLEDDGLVLTVRWDYVEDPYRVGAYRIEIAWPELPKERRTAARRVAAHCSVKNTLATPPEIQVSVAD